MADGGVVARQPAILVYKPQITRENWFAEVVDTEFFVFVGVKGCVASRSVNAETA